MEKSEVLILTEYFNCLENQIYFLFFIIIPSLVPTTIIARKIIMIAGIHKIFPK